MKTNDPTDCYLFWSAVIDVSLKVVVAGCLIVLAYLYVRFK